MGRFRRNIEVFNLFYDSQKFTLSCFFLETPFGKEKGITKPPECSYRGTFKKIVYPLIYTTTFWGWSLLSPFTDE